MKEFLIFMIGVALFAVAVFGVALVITWPSFKRREGDTDGNRE